MIRTALITILCFAMGLGALSQGENFDPNVKSVKLYRFGNQTSFPAITLGDVNALELHFDDLDPSIKNYYYTYQLCNADWSYANMKPFDYIRGFQNVRINTYRNSSISIYRYIHYTAQLPDRTCMPTRTGNYILKVYRDNDTSKVVFTRKFVIYENKVALNVQLLQPFSNNMFRYGHKVNVTVALDARLRVVNPNELKIVVLQNNNWQTSLLMTQPSIYRGNYFEYSDEAINIMPAGKEFRWIDLRSLRLMSDRMLRLDNRKDTTDVYVKPDATRESQVYLYYNDINGSFTMETMENVNPFWQGDYARVHFSYFPPGNQPIAGEDVFLFGEFTNFAADTSGKLSFNPERGAYEKTLLLKQGYYNYTYVTRQRDKEGYPDFSATEGNYYGTENSYVVLVYYRSFGGRADELVGVSITNSLFQR